jgi:hypothetical protein
MQQVNKVVVFSRMGSLTALAIGGECGNPTSE